MSGHADDIEVLNRAREWLHSGQRVALATVVRTWGSSPRPPGSLLAMNGEGRFVGSVSGGCVEETLVECYRNGEIASPTPTLIDFGVSGQEASRLGLPCGGRLELLVEELTEIGAIEAILLKIQNGELLARAAIVALAHDPRQDDLGLSAALETQAFYIGALGSTRSAQARRERLRSLGFSEQQIARVHGPAGLPIGSKHPAEIAVSILAEITAIRNATIENAMHGGEA